MIRRIFTFGDTSQLLVVVDPATGAVTAATRAYPTDPWSAPLDEIANEDDEPGALRRYGAE